MGEEVETRTLEWKIEPWVQAYLEWPQTIQQLNPGHILHVIDAFHAGWEAAMEHALAITERRAT